MAKRVRAEDAGDLVDEIRRRNKAQVYERIKQSAAEEQRGMEAGLRRAQPRPLPTAPSELGPPGSSVSKHGSAGEGFYDLARAKKRRAKIARIRGGEAVA